MNIIEGNVTRRSLLFAGAAAALATGKPTAQIGIMPVPQTILLSWNFTNGSQGWLAGFSDYTLGMQGLERIAELRPLPPETGVQGSGYFLQSMNRSDDMFMFLKRQIGPEQGILPNQRYHASMHIQVASNAATGCMGVGGAPGESVYLKAGVTAQEPTTTLIGDYVQFNLDKGNQAAGGAQLQVIGDMANGQPCELPEAPRYIMLERILYQNNIVTADSHGALWMTVGTDSGYEGLTGLYYYTIGVVLQPAG